MEGDDDAEEGEEEGAVPGGEDGPVGEGGAGLGPLD